MKKTVILNEGGMGAGGKGHMDHPYENVELTFSEIKQLFQAASQGFPKLKVTEKLDGQNLLISYDPALREAVAVRNKTQARAGGYTKGRLIAAMTTDRPEGKRTPQNVVDAFAESMDNFKKVAEKVPKEYFYTDEGARIFYNSEVIDPRSVNVVDYDSQTLIIHRTGHIKVLDGTVSGLNSEESEAKAALLEEMLSDLQDDSIPTVGMNAVRDFTDFIEKKDTYKRAISNIDNQLRENGLSDENTIRDFLLKRISSRITRTMSTSNLSDEAIQKFAEGILFYGVTKNLPRKRTEVAAALNEVPEQLQNERNIIATTLSDRGALKEMSKAASYPLEMIVHRFAVDILENFKSVYIIQSEVAVNKLKSKLQKKIKDVRASADENDLRVLNVGIRKILDSENEEDVLSDDAIQAAVEKITTAVEGIVFDFNGRTYKLTGNFAPINQIMGLGRFSRSPGKRDDIVEEDITDSEEEIETRNSRRKIAVFPGKFKPPHRGHLYLVKEVLRKGADIVVIMVSPLEKDDISAENSIDLWNAYISRTGIDPNKVIIIKSPYNSPVMASYAIMDEPVSALAQKKIPSPGDMIIPVASTKKDSKGVSDLKRFARYHEYSPKIEGVTPADVREWAIDPEGDEMGSFNASDFRPALQSGADISRFIPREISQDEVRNILGFLSQEQGSSTTQSSLGESEVSIFTLIEEAINENDWQPFAKKRMRKSMKNLLTKGNKKIASKGAPFTSPVTIGNSNSFLAKEEKEEKNCGCGQNPCKTYGTENKPEEIEEMSAMASGAIAGHMGAAPPKKTKKKKKKTNYYTSRA